MRSLAATLALLAATASLARAGEGPVEATARELTKLEKAATVLVPDAVPFGLRNIVLNKDNPIWVREREE